MTHDGSYRFLNAGICENCRHARVVRHPRGGMDYWRCGRSDGDSSFPKYPRLPVLACPGHEDGEPQVRETTS